ncbi:MAG TPA: 3-phosphoserine/phosphohydroxythreonine transaminase [Woeseiaceae bacterium]|nr:3-phosphoserine/phosphohydroxythreonine transaminase [Woeseiaceae bacterium]
MKRAPTRVFNFSAGPAVLPTDVLERIRDDLPDWHGGMSVMEVSHRSREFTAVAEQAEQDLRDLLSIPDDYAVLFMQGGATLQFAMVPLNLAEAGDRADYVNTGHWSKKAISEAQRFADVNVAADAAASNYCDIPDPAGWQRSAEAAYLHYTPNETIGGVEFHLVPDTGEVPLVADMSSTILSRPVDVSRFGVVYAGAQKNIGPAGITVVIVRKSLLGRARDGVPTLLRYSTYAESASMSNTPPTFAWYVAGLVFADLKAKGGVAAMGAVNERKARKLYAAIDTSPFYSNPVRHDCRSWMNVPFVLQDPALDARFLAEAQAAGLMNLRGHRAVGGMRASIYNAMPEAGVDALIDFMQDFEKRV